MDASDRNRVVISGIGLVTPLGAERESSWAAIKAGRSAVGWLGALDARGACYLGAPAAPLPLSSGGRPGGEPVVRLALEAADQAVADSQLDLRAADRDRIGCVIGSSKGGVRSFARAYGSRHWSRRQNGDPDRLSVCRDCWTAFVPSSAAGSVAAAFDLRGPLLCPIAACATGVLAVLQAADAIRDGRCDLALAGSADASLEPTMLAAFSRMGVLAKDSDDPQQACRPFDARRRGFVVGEGAAVLVVESLASARGRGAPVYAELLAGASAAEAYHAARLRGSPDTLCHVIASVLRRGKCTPENLDYVNLHGTATVSNDRIETEAMKHALGRRAYGVPLSATKSMIGHLLGAAGSVELAVTLLAMRDGFVPPTINLTNPDPQCDLDYTPLVGRAQRVETALKVSQGFGGHVIAALLRRWPGVRPRGDRLLVAERS